MGNLRITFVLIQTIYCGTYGVFLHEPSKILLEPSNTVPESEFGFTMGYQYGDKPQLVIGAPRNTYIGKVYSCPMKSSLQNVTGPTLTCDSVDIDFEKTVTGATRDGFPINYYFGGSIVGTKDYFLTCAPMMTSKYKSKKYGFMMLDLFGSCIMYNDTAYEYHGTFQQLKKTKPIAKTTTVVGGAGWSTLVDEVNGLLIIMKTGLIGDITYVPLDDPLAATTSVRLDSPKISVFLKDYRNVGFGITYGKYFSTETIYAISLQLMEMTGAIVFMSYNKNTRKFGLYKYGEELKNNAMISDNTVGSMFGTVMFSAKLNLDEFSDILIGAPTHVDKPQSSETGAVHIFIGGDVETIYSSDRMRTILGTNDFARFGTALAASDIDGDGLPEMFISAPYDGLDTGTLYVLSGLEVYEKLLKQPKIRKILVSDLVKTQIIKGKEQSKFGFSLQVVPDKDSNGCDELAVGAPGSNVVHMFRCIPTIEVAVSAKLLGEPIVKETADHFTMEVCVNVVNVVNVTKNLEKYELDLEVSTKVGIGNKAESQKPMYLKHLSSDKDNPYCDNVTVTLTDKNPGLYTFHTQIKISKEMENNILNNTEFNNTWVILSPRSKTEDIRTIKRHCGDDCRPIWNVTLEWCGEKDSYDLGSEEPASISVTVQNDGNSSYDSCLLLHVDGAQFHKNTCEFIKNDGVDYMKCYLQNPFNRGKQQKIDIKLNMNEGSNSDKKLYVDVSLYENCAQLEYTEVVKNMSLKYTLATDRVDVLSTHNDRKFTDQELQESDEKYKPFLYDNHEYEINNGESIVWKDISAVLKIDKKPYLDDVKVFLRGSDHGCIQKNLSTFYIFNCTMDLERKSKKRIVASMNITKKNIMDYVVDKKFITNSYLELHLQPTIVVKNVSSTTNFYFSKELTFGNNINMIILVAVLVAFVILSVIILILYKLNFFKRKEKKDLKVLRESVRKHSIKKSSSSSKQVGSVTDDVTIMNLVIEEDPFDEPGTSQEHPQEPFKEESADMTADDIVLIEEKAQVHC